MDEEIDIFTTISAEIVEEAILRLLPVINCSLHNPNVDTFLVFVFAGGKRIY